MSWMDDRLGERKVLEEREQRIFAEAPRLHGELWKEILKQIEEAKTKGFKILMVDPDEIVLPVNPSPGPRSVNPRKLRLNLKKDHSVLVANMTGGDATFTIDLYNNEVVLKHEDKVLSVSEATILVLDRFLFPELKRLDAHKLGIWKNL